MKTVGIYGAGAAGRLLAADLSMSNTSAVSFFIDDDPKFAGKRLFGAPIFPLKTVSDRNMHEQVDEIHVALPSASLEVLTTIYDRLQVFKKPILTIPTDVVHSHSPLSSSDLFPYLITNVVGRNVASIHSDSARQFIKGKHIFITGAGGTIGSEIAKQCVLLDASTITLVDASEFALYTVENSLRPLLRKTLLRSILINICDIPALRNALKVRPDIVFHAAAFKHVPLVEGNVSSAIKNNIVGTSVLLDACREKNISNFVLISSDKAVRPTNVMGATKRVCEILTIEANKESPASERYSMVRFGNVIGSSGSVVPLFNKQILDGGPVTITHDDITRFFMSIGEAAQLVIHAGSLSRGGEVFLLDMGQPVKIRDLAEKMIEYYGYSVRQPGRSSGIEIITTGLRPGEKLFEELLIDGQAISTPHPQIFQSLDGQPPQNDFFDTLALLVRGLYDEPSSSIKNTLKKLVPEYTSSLETQMPVPRDF